MEAMLTEYRENIQAQIDACTDVSMLDLIHKLLTKSQRREESRNNGKEKL